MIVQKFAEMIFTILTKLLGWIHIPFIPNSVDNMIEQYLDILGSGIELFYYFIPTNVISFGIPILLAIMAFKYGYYFIMWILKKIPMAGIS